MFVVIGLGPLVRPELGLVSIAFIIASLMCIRPAAGPAIVLLSSAGLLPAAYEVFRAGYYGLLVPLPALAKEAATTDLPRGAAYVWDFVVPYWLTWPLVAVGALVAAGLFRRSRGVE
jgi:arabinofuranosyltransferase